MNKRFKRLDAYAGPLTIDQAAEGIAAAVANARSLLGDAELLVVSERWPRAVSLSILAIEEIGKVSLIRSLLLADSDKERKEEWRNYRRHTRKNYMGAFLDCVTGSPKIEDFRRLLDSEEDHPALIDALKQLGFYSDCLGKAHWSIPADIIDEDLARQFFASAKIAIPDDTPPMSTAQELQLWVKHIKPVWKKDMLTMKNAFIRCFEEASSLGVLNGSNDVDDARNFLF